jgi:mRNA interferase HigB
MKPAAPVTRYLATQSPLQTQSLPEYNLVRDDGLLFDSSQLAKYSRSVHIVTIGRLQQAAEAHPMAAKDLAAWIKVVRTARWQNFAEVRACFPDADNVDGFVIFNIRHNRYRLIVVVHYAKLIDDKLTLGHVYIGGFMTHGEYDRWCDLNERKRAEWLQF